MIGDQLCGCFILYKSWRWKTDLWASYVWIRNKTSLCLNILAQIKTDDLILQGDCVLAFSTFIREITMTPQCLLFCSRTTLNTVIALFNKDASTHIHKNSFLFWDILVVRIIKLIVRKLSMLSRPIELAGKMWTPSAHRSHTVTETCK